ncbi:MAG TPA: ribose-phosphate pyrophosphokinase [Candidatus Binataceae bacterium]|nr:ribose-phosphate pyrophosphokinase [Candidatus Binataceae bacterium]
MMDPIILAGLANLPLAAAVAEQMGLTLANRALTRFPDSELHIEVQESVRSRDVYLVEPTGPPVDQRLFELMMLADACRRAGAACLTAVIPYFGYARQDRRATGRDPVGARLVADLLKTAGIQRVVTIDLHSAALEGFFPMPLEHLSAVALLADGVASSGLAADAVIVAPDLGAVKLAQRYARLLRKPLAIVNKTRLSGEEVEARGVVGEVRGRPILIIDDMITTGATIAAAAGALTEAGASSDVTVAATHGLFVGGATQRLKALGVKRFIVTDSVAQPTNLGLPLQLVSVAPLLGEAIKRLHTDRSLSDLITHV